MGTLSQDQAARTIRKLKKPDGMRQPTWLLMKSLLRELVRYLPNVHPGQRALATRLHSSQSVVQRLIVRAETEGWIERSDHVYGGKPRAGTSYRLAFVPTQLATHLAPVTGSEKTSPSGSEVPETKSQERVWFAPEAPRARSLRRRDSRAFHSRQPNRYDGHCHVCTYPVAAFFGFLHGPLPVHRQCQSGQPDWPRLKEYLMTHHREQFGNPATWGDAYGDDPNAPLPQYSPPPAQPQARLAKHFDYRWDGALRQAKEWRGLYRGIDLGAAIGYCKVKFLDAGYNEEHVMAMIDEFFADLLDPESDLMMRDGQTCWQLFTGWWGRNPVPDPVPIRKERERLDRLNAAVAEHIASLPKPEPPPIRRRVLTPP